MPNTVTINFIECNPAPANGYRLTWRVAGSSDPYTDEGLFTESPAIFQDAINPEGTCYEGYLQSDCSESGESGSVVGNAIAWATVCEEESGSTTYTITLQGSCLPGNPFSTFLIEGGAATDTVKVRASFIGLLQMTGGLFTKAELGISSPNGSGEIVLSACYADAAPHGFSITADCDIVMAGATEPVYVTAVVHNSSESATNVVVSIIEINGVPVNISASGCKGNSATGGTC